MVRNESFENQYQEELPYIEQSASWMAGMTYRWSPNNYSLSPRQVDSITECGSMLGKYLDQKYQNVLEFRIDFIPNEEGSLFVSEVQTDDRGFPAMANTENVRRPELDFPGITESFAKSLKEASGKKDASLVIVFPDDEFFYYAGYFDIARLLWCSNEKLETVVVPKSCISETSRTQLSVNIKIEGCRLNVEPDFVWDFSNTLNTSKGIQPPVTKQLMVDIWSQESPLTKSLRPFVPETRVLPDLEVEDDKNNWVIKPVDGKWSEGIIFGASTKMEVWRRAVSERNGDLIAQRFVRPQKQLFDIRKMFKAEPLYKQEELYARVEGYFTKNSDDWLLSNILATCTQEIPVHGSRDCIMIPGEIKPDRIEIL